MPEFSNLLGYDVKDATARAAIEALETKTANDIETLNTNMSNAINVVQQNHDEDMQEMREDITTRIAEIEEADETLDNRVNSLENVAGDNTNRIAALEDKPDGVFLPHNTCGAITHMLNVAKTYFDHAEEFEYGNYYTAFNTVCEKQGEKWWIDCSSFVQLCLQGIPFENSRYNGNAENIPTRGVQFDELITDPETTRTQGMLANGLAEYAYKHGLLYEIKEDITTIRPGDVLFICNSPNENYFRKIGHCVIVTGTCDYNGKIYCVGVSNNNETFNREIYTVTNTQVKYAARFPLDDSAVTLNDIANGLNTWGETTATIAVAGVSTKLKRVYLSREIKGNKLYTLIMKTANPIPAGYHFAIYTNVNGTFSQIQPFGERDGGTEFIIPFWTLKDVYSAIESRKHFIDIYILCNETNDNIRNISIDIDYISVYEGYVPRGYHTESNISPDMVMYNIPDDTDAEIKTEEELDAFIAALYTEGYYNTVKEKFINLTNYSGTRLATGRYKVYNYHIAPTIGYTVFINASGKPYMYVEFNSAGVHTFKKISLVDLTQ